MPAVSHVLGLGNPGREYQGTRHNLGFAVVEEVASRRKLRWRGDGKKAESTLLHLRGRQVKLVKPLTFMNRSGEALEVCRGAEPASILVVCDDIHLPLGTIRIRAGGGGGGHRGLESIERELGTGAYPRLRLGVGPAPDGSDWSDFVLGRFTGEEIEAAGRVVEEGADAVETALARSIDAAQQAYNGKI